MLKHNNVAKLIFIFCKTYKQKQIKYANISTYKSNLYHSKTNTFKTMTPHFYYSVG